VAGCSPRSVKSASAASSSSQEEVDVAFETTVSAVRAESSQVWNSIELYDLYQSNGGRDISRRTLSYQIVRIYFGSDLLVLSGTGVASLLAFRSKASSLLRLVPSSDENDVEIELEKVAHQIVCDVNESVVDDNNYYARVDMDIALDCVSSTFVIIAIKAFFYKTEPYVTCRSHLKYNCY